MTSRGAIQRPVANAVCAALERIALRCHPRRSFSVPLTIGKIPRSAHERSRTSTGFPIRS